MNCDRCRELLSDHLDGRLSDEEEQAFQVALEACPDCRAELREFEGMIDELRAVPTPRPPADLGIRLSTALREEIRREDAGEVEGSEPSLLVRLGRWRIAAAVLALCFGAWGLFQGEDRDAGRNTAARAPATQVADAHGGVKRERDQDRQGGATMSPVEAKDGEKKAPGARKATKWEGAESGDELDEESSEDLNALPPSLKPSGAVFGNPSADPQDFAGLDERERKALSALSTQLKQEEVMALRLDRLSKEREESAPGGVKSKARKRKKKGAGEGTVTLGEPPVKDEASQSEALRSGLSEKERAQPSALAARPLETRRSYILRGANEARLDALLKKRGQAFEVRDIALLETDKSAGRLIELEIEASEASELLKALQAQIGAQALLVATEYRAPSPSPKQTEIKGGGKGSPVSPAKPSRIEAGPGAGTSIGSPKGNSVPRGEPKSSPKVERPGAAGSPPPEDGAPKKRGRNRGSLRNLDLDPSASSDRRQHGPRLRIRFIIPQ